MFDLPGYIRRRMEIMGISRVSATGTHRELLESSPAYRLTVTREEAGG